MASSCACNGLLAIDVLELEDFDFESIPLKRQPPEGYPSGGLVMLVTTGLALVQDQRDVRGQ